MTTLRVLYIGDDADSAMFTWLGVTAIAGEEPMRACAVETVW